MTPPLVWRRDLAGRIDELGRWLQGRVLLEPRPADEVVPARSYADAARLRAAVVRSMSITDRQPDCARPTDDELAIAASRLARHYSAALTAVALVGLSRGIGVDMSAARRTMIVRYNVPFGILLDLTDRDVLRDAGREAVWLGLYAGHLLPLFTRLARITTVAPALLWTNAAEWVGIISDSAVEYLGLKVAKPIVAECAALLAAPRLPGVPGRNPIGDKLVWFPGDGKGFPHAVQTRRVCCRTYLLRDRFGRLCQNCPYLPLTDRIALVRERHGVPMGAIGGAAERRSIEHGLARRSARQVLDRKHQDTG